MDKVELDLGTIGDVKQRVSTVGKIEHPEHCQFAKRLVNLPTHRPVQSPFPQSDFTLGVQIPMPAVASSTRNTAR